MQSNDPQFEAGLATRKQVMGEDFVVRAFEGVTDFTAPLLTALSKQNERKGHVRGALNDGATVQEIQEVLLHATVYCGVPTAVEAFRILCAGRAQRHVVAQKTRHHRRVHGVGQRDIGLRA